MTADITIDGLSFAVTTEGDRNHGAPWDEEDGHGLVSEWTRRDKAPGERVLSEDRGTRRYYDFAGTVSIARRDKWGLDEASVAPLAGKLGRAPKPGDIAAAAAERDYQRLRAWCGDQWNYVGVVVELLDVDGNGTGETESLWGIESDSGDYLDEVAQELAETLAERFKGQGFIERVTRIRAAS